MAVDAATYQALVDKKREPEDRAVEALRKEFAAMYAHSGAHMLAVGVDLNATGGDPYRGFVLEL